MATDSHLALIAGLGNPGREYEQTRHNIGFLVLDELARQLPTGQWRAKFGAEHYAQQRNGLVLVKPMQFMNDSGPPLQATAHFFRISPERMLVISDDLDLPLGKLRMRPHGGHGGHNGLRSIIANVGTQFPRLRIGIGRANDALEQTVIKRVLGNFDTNEQPLLQHIIKAAATGALLWQREGIDPAMRFLNTWTLDANVTKD